MHSAAPPRTTGDRGGRLRGSLISLQVALSLVLITCAGLLGRSLAKLESQDFGVVSRAATSSRWRRR